MANWTPERIDQAHNTVAAHVVDSIEALEALNELNRALEDQQAELDWYKAKFERHRWEAYHDLMRREEETSGE